MMKQDFIPVSHSNRPQNPMAPAGLLFHTTNNWSSTADAQSHSRYLKSGQSGETGWHVTVDASQTIQHIPFDENAWHAGDGGSGEYNLNWIGLEICTNQVTSNEKLDDATYQNAVQTAAEIVKEFHFTREQLQPHHVVYGKNCSWDQHFDRDQFKEDVFSLAETEVGIMGRFKDVPDESWSVGAIENVAEQGLIVGFSDGNFRPKEPVTREQLAVILVRLQNQMGVQ